MLKDFIAGAVIAAVLLAVIIISTADPKPPAEVLVGIGCEGNTYVVVATAEAYLPNCMDIEVHEVH